MNRYFRLSISICVVLLLCAGAVSAQEQPTTGKVAQEEAGALPDRFPLVKQWAKQLQSAVVEERQAALDSLIKLEGIAIEVLKGLADTKAEIQRKVAEDALAKLTEAYIEQLNSDAFKQRQKSFSLIYKIGAFATENLTKEVEELQQAGENTDRRRLIERLLLMIEFRISPKLYELIGEVFADYDSLGWRQRISKVKRLERLGRLDAKEALERIVEREKNIVVKAEAANALIRVAGEKALQFLKKHGLVRQIQAPELTRRIYISQGIKYMEIEKYDLAIEEFRKVLKRFPADYQANYHIAMCYLLKGSYKLSVKHFKVCLEQAPKENNLLYNIACAYALMGAIKQAIDYFRSAVENGFDNLQHIKEDKDLDNIRNDPRFKEIIKKLQQKQKKKKDF